MIIATNLKHAWELAKGILDRDVEHNPKASANAGCKVYSAVVNEIGNNVSVIEQKGCLKVTDSKGELTIIEIVNGTDPVPEGDGEIYPAMSEDEYTKAKREVKNQVRSLGEALIVTEQRDATGILATYSSHSGTHWFREHYTNEYEATYWTSNHPEKLIVRSGFNHNENFDYLHFLKHEAFYFSENGEGGCARAYDRRLKAKEGFRLAYEEFIEEARVVSADMDEAQTTNARNVYDKLIAMMDKGEMKPYSMMSFSHLVRQPSVNTDMIQACLVGCNKWEVNFCLEEVTVEKAKCLINEEFGFEVGRIKILGVPCYDATDYNYIRFDCAGLTWLMIDGELKSVWE